MLRSFRFSSLLFWAGVLLTAHIAGCSRDEPPPAAAIVTAPVPDAGAMLNRMSACEMMNASEMTVLLGGAVDAQPSGASKCVYAPVAGDAPYAELEIDRGQGNAAFKRVPKTGLIEPGSPNPLAGLGDQTAQVGPVLLVRSGADLVKITVSGSKNGAAALRAIFMLVKPRL